ncbi:Multifunctional non-homologous end joining protein LigD [Alphaproteobacteria bacterium SO-S41]|nr:Multifunctional non-homologous end joining protein LigD [Alphaproteobacteria bacterium SO-S41]
MAARKSSGRRDGTLAEYNARRDFKATAEPRGVKAKVKGDRFVVQKHDATRLHFDLRLEHDGVLKSWAVTRGPSMVPGEKRLAVQTEDHPLKYLDFEGVIPKGEYGAGTMIVWDQGRWAAQHDAAKGFKKGHLDFVLAGKRLKGSFHLVRMRRKAKEKRDNWLLIKSDDEFAMAPKGKALVERETGSILSDRTNADLEKAGVMRADHAARRKVAKARQAPTPKVTGGRKAILPPFVEPQLATLVAEAPQGDAWLHEIKYDGYRIQARIDGADIKLLTRKGLDWTKTFQPVARALAALKLPSALLDGEIVVEDESGRSDFSALQAALKSDKAGTFVYRVFDLLYADGRDLRALPLTERKTLLEKLLSAAPGDGAVRFSEHIEADGDAMVRHVCRLGLEGVISKRADAPYRSGRERSWVKTKCSDRQELVIAGYMPSSVAKGAVGSLIMGVQEKGGLVHVGRVGTGYTATVARALAKKLKPLEVNDPPFAAKLPRAAAKGARWVRPDLVAEVEFRGFTGDGMVRQAAFKGLREDKDAADVVRERPKATSIVKAKAAAKAPVAGKIYKLTHPDRVYWPDTGLTKQGLAEYYDAIADRILPHIAGRPLSLVRCPGGITEQCFFQKHGWDGMPAAIHRVTKGGDEHVWIEDRAGLLALVQSGALEIHVWGATLAKLETPDRIVFDLDPAEDVTWERVIEGALEVRKRLKKTGLTSFVKTSGGKGLHVVAPLTPRKGWDKVKDFTRAVADAMAKDEPDRYVSNMSKKLRKGRIFIDYLRNGRAQTSVATFSTRARPGAAVATPIAWSELGPDLTPARFTVENLGARLDHLKRDPWAGFFRLKQTFNAKGV